MDDIIEKAHQYFRTYSIVGRAHYIAWETAARKNKWLGIPVVITTTIVGTAIFGTLQESPGVAWKIVAGLLSLSAAVLSTLQTTLKYSEIAEKHKTAGAKYAAMRRGLDIFILKHRGESKEKRQVALQEFEEIATKFAELAEESPSIPDKVYDRAAHEFDKEDIRLATFAPKEDA
jgi:predicted methyltransferase